MQAATVGTRVGRREHMKKGRFAPTLLISLAIAAVLACIFTVAADARPRSSVEPILTRIQLHTGRLWKRHSKRVHAGPLDARAAIVGGSRISIEQAPWQVVVIALIPESETILICGGSILNETEVLTAAHCVFNPSSKARIAPEDIVIGAGAEDIEIEPEQVTVANEVRVHPYYDPAAALPAPDDVAVLKLETPLVFNRDVQPISPISGGLLVPEGTAVDLTGFGMENPATEELNGALYGIGMTLRYSRECGGEADALFLCASSPDGSLCLGDSGGGLTVPDSPAMLAGVADTVQVINHVPCRPGAMGGFANVAAPEIRDFIVEGNEHPPRAPRGGGAAISGIPIVGKTLSCEPGGWSNAPTFTYMFIDGNRGEVLQRGPSPTYTLTKADIGRSILCEVLAANAGGTGVGRTPALEAVQRNPLAEQEEEAAARKHSEEEAAGRKHAEEGAPAAGKPPEEHVAKGGVLASKESARLRSPTRAQLLRKALKACRKQPTKHRRDQCEAQARRKYGSVRRGGKEHKKQ
jgi:hypothetical protein